MARDNTWTFTAEEVAQITKLPKRQFRLGAGNVCTGYFDDANRRFYECDDNGKLTGRVGSAKKQTTIVVPATNGGDDPPPAPPEKKEPPKKEPAKKPEPPKPEPTPPPSGTADAPDWRELKRQEEERLKAEKQREREEKKKRKPAVSASDAAGTSMVPVSPFKRFMKKVVLPIVAVVACGAIAFCVYSILANRSTPIGYQYPTVLQRSDGTTVTTSYVHGDSVQVIQVTDDVLQGTQFSKDNLAVATIPADVYNCAVAIGSKLCNVDMANTVVGKYATEYIGAGQILRIDQFSVNSTTGTSVAANPWLAEDGEDVRDYLWEDDTSFLMFGREAVITITRTVDDNNAALREELYADDPTIEYTISEKDEHNRRHETIKLNAVVSDLLNSDGTLLYDVYAKLGAIPQGELSQYVKNHVSVAKMVPTIVRFRMTEKAATVYDATMVTGADVTLTSGTVTTVELLEELEANTPERVAQLNICQFVDRILCGDNTVQNTDPVQ